MLKSMTGYGRSQKENEGGHVTVEMKTVNHRFCEINVRMPRQLFFMEERLKKMISRYVNRGKVDVFLNLQGEAVVKRSLSIDWDLFHQYHDLFEKMVETSVASEAFPVNELLLHEDVVSVKEADEVSKDLQSSIEGAVEEAVQKLVDMRKAEGEKLLEDMSNRLTRLSGYVSSLREYAPAARQHYEERLQKRVDEFIAGKTDIDESRILTEVAVYADKSDIEEELTRIDSHINQFSEILDGEGAVGRKLDFLVQELNRETNTVGSKANHLEISRIVVNVKAELEKIREQVQNVE